MVIKKLHTRNIMGLPGDQCFEFPENMAFMLAPNGTGKTSVITALRYAITGAEPGKDMVHKGAASCAVQIDTPQGCFMRSKRIGKNAVYKINNKSASFKELNERLEAAAGCDLKSAALLTSSELLEAMDSRQFGDLILKYLPEVMDKESVISKVSEVTPLMRKIMEENLPDGDFGSDMLGKFFSFLTEERRKVKKEEIQLQTEIKILGDTFDETGSEQELRDRQEALEKQRDDAVLYENNMQNYLRIKSMIEKSNDTLKKLEQEIQQITAVRHPDAERKAVNDLMMASRKTALAAQEAKRQDKSLYDTLRKAADTIVQPVCPLSENLKCTTDKTPIIDELRTAVNTACDSYKKHAQEMNEAKEKALAAEENLRVIDEDNRAADRKAQLEQQRRQLNETMPVLPERPEKGPDLAVINNELAGIRSALQKLKDRQRAVDAKNKLEETKALRAALEKLYESFDSKGEVKRALTRYYLDEFSGPLNDKAMYLFPAMKIKFESEDGVRILVDAKGVDKYVPLASLSGGEKIAVAFLIMLTFGSLSGLRIVILDELSVLDPGVLDGLLTVMENNKDEFDLALMASANHEDTASIVAAHNIPLINVG